MATFGLDASS